MAATKPPLLFRLLPRRRLAISILFVGDRNSWPKFHLLCSDGELGWSQFWPVPAFLHGFDMNCARPLGGLHDDLSEPIEERSFRLLVALLAIRIAVANPDELAFARNVEPDEIVRSRHGTAFFIQRFDGQNRDVFAVGVDRGAIGGQLDGDRRTGCLALRSEDHFAIFAAARFDGAGLVLDFPLNMTKPWNLLAAEGLAIVKQLDFIQIRVHPDRYLITFPALEVPMRKKMDHRLLAPPRFVVKECVLRKSAHIDNAKLRIDRGPAVGRRLAAIVEAGPGKAARLPLARPIERPPLFGGLAPLDNSVICIHGIPQWISGIDAPG